MKNLFALAGMIMLAAPASAAIQTLGGPLAQNCYELASSKNNSRFAVEGCTRALAEEGLTSADRAATLVNRGIVHMIGGQGSAAERDFDAALAIDAALADAFLNKGFLRIRTGTGARRCRSSRRASISAPRRKPSPGSDAASRMSRWAITPRPIATSAVRANWRPTGTCRRPIWPTIRSAAARAGGDASAPNGRWSSPAASGSTARCWSARRSSRCAPTRPSTHRRPRPARARASGSARSRTTR